MTREIKFRAWHHKGCMENQPMTMSYWELGSGLDNSQFFKHAQAVMQYTGLKDKNGKEIYEGDIVSRGGKTQNKVIRFDEKSGGWELSNSFSEKIGYLSLTKVVASKIEVIGDIYQTPELLNN